MMDLYHSLSGMVVGELTAADISGALLALSDAGISIYSVEQKSDLTVLITVRRSDTHAATRLCQKRGYTLRILKNKGMYWMFRSALKRPVLIAGCVCLLLFVLYLPTRILFVEVEGNERIPDRQILEAAQICGVSFGASRREVRSERIKNALLQELPQLQWAGVNTRGCVARICVREKALMTEQKTNEFPGNMVALREGIILSCTATRGNLLCKPGQAVTKGQILISGYTDCGLKIEVCAPEGEIYARTIRELEVILPAVYREKTEITRTDRDVTLLLGKKRINLWKDSGIWEGSCGRIYEENYITLPGGFRLPFGWAVDTCYYGNIAETVPSAEREPAEAFAKNYLTQQMIAGAILSQKTDITCHSDFYRLTGEYVCTEMIGTWQAEKIGEVNGKSG